MLFIHLFAFVFVFRQARAALQTPFQFHSPARRALQGRFLHITDLHPDPHYLTNASVSSSCHRLSPPDELERAGYWGSPWNEDCDSPMRFLDFTFDYLEKNWADEIDFVIWTGDNARHDNDRKTPRTIGEIYDSNRGVAAQMEKVFTSRGIPVVPSLGNNDIWPHNILAAGPNPITHTFVEIWQTFIPFSSYQVFQRGAYFTVDVIPNQVAAISLNTVYFYDSNKAVGGCEYGSKDDPGNLQFDWLDVQLRIFRERGMQVYLTGHIPPSRQNYFPECFRRYTELSLRFQDTIIGHLYGHMNLDHFFVLTPDDIMVPPVRAGSRKHFVVEKSLRKDFRKVPKKSKTDEDDFVFVTAAPALVANPYVPSFRIFSYNITGAEDNANTLKRKKKGKKGKKGKGRKSKDCQRKKNRDKWACRPQKPRHCDPTSPSRSNTLWTPLGYSQYYVSNLDMDNTTQPSWELEYLTYRLSALHPHANATSAEAAAFAYPVPVHLLPSELRDVSKITTSGLAPYKMDDLTIKSWLKLVRKLVKKKGLWQTFTKFMYLEAT